MKMPRSFLFCSAIFFLGGLHLLLFGGLLGSNLGLILGLVLVLMGGVPLLITWWKDLCLLLSSEQKSADSADTSTKEDTKE